MVFISIIPESQLDGTLGSLFMGLVLTSVLWGAGCLQLYFYYEKYWKRDQLWLRAYVFIVWIFDTAHQVLLVESMYRSMVRGLADPTLYIRLPRTAINMGIITAIIDAMVQIIFVRRAWYLSNRNRFLAGILCADVLAQFIVAALYYGQIYNLTAWSQFTEVVHTELIMNSISVFTDAFLAVVLIWLLWKSRSGIKKTDSIINRLVMYIVGSGLVTVVCTIVALIGAQMAPHLLIYLLFDLLFPKLYFNCLLASLNARSSLRETLGNDVHETTMYFEERVSVSLTRSNSSIVMTSSSDVTDSKAKESGKGIDIERGPQKEMHCDCEQCLQGVRHVPLGYFYPPHALPNHDLSERS